MSAIALTPQARLQDFRTRNPHAGPVPALEGALAETLAELRTLQTALADLQRAAASHDVAMALLGAKVASEALAIVEEHGRAIASSLLRSTVQGFEKAALAAKPVA
jgi:hypothetical protein